MSKAEIDEVVLKEAEWKWMDVGDQLAVVRLISKAPSAHRYHKQPFSTILCGYSMWYFLKCEGRYYSNPEDDHDQNIDDREIQMMISDFCWFFRREIYHKRGRFFYTNSYMVDDPKYTKLIEWERNREGPLIMRVKRIIAGSAARLAIAAACHAVIVAHSAVAVVVIVVAATPSRTNDPSAAATINVVEPGGLAAGSVCLFPAASRPPSHGPWPVPNPAASGSSSLDPDPATAVLPLAVAAHRVIAARHCRSAAGATRCARERGGHGGVFERGGR
uniref:Uncharacterized protein n=1 Tax=Leersia perrieri TaxID=77586 RepID=A0A0D9XQZ2_9ORYZ